MQADFEAWHDAARQGGDAPVYVFSVLTLMLMIPAFAAGIVVGMWIWR